MSVTLGGEPQSHPAWNGLHILFLMLVVCAVHYLPEVALFGVDEADSGILLVGICGTKLFIFTGKVFKLHTHCHWFSVCLRGWRHDALNGFICFPKKLGNRCNHTSCDVYKCSKRFPLIFDAAWQSFIKSLLRITLQQGLESSRAWVIKITIKS